MLIMLNANCRRTLQGTIESALVSVGDSLPSPTDREHFTALYRGFLGAGNGKFQAGGEWTSRGPDK